MSARVAPNMSCVAIRAMGIPHTLDTSGTVREAREEWLAYRGVTDLERVHSPAGLDIGARNPKEIAIAVVGEMVAEQTGSPA